MKKILILAAFAYLAASTAVAQNYESDAVKMMRNSDLSGTARSLGVGGAYSSVGADMSSMSSNPAGIALYRSHELALSAGAVWGSTESVYHTGTTNQQSSSDFVKGSFSQIGLILATKKLSKYNDLRYRRSGSALDRFVFGFGYQKVADFNRTDYFYGTNSSSSLAQAYAIDVNKPNADGTFNPIDLDHYSPSTFQAYQVGAIYQPDSTSPLFASRFGYPVRQTARITTQGALHDINLTLGFNIANTIYIGGGLGVPYMDYSRYSYFNESNIKGDSSYISNLNYNLSGLGVNGKFGVIVKPVQWLRLGAAIQTPTYYRLDENTSSNANTIFKGQPYPVDTGSIYRFTYNNPLKATFGLSLYYKTWGFLSVDYELNDYSHTRYSFDGAQSEADYWNKLIAAKYKAASTVRVGAEFSYKVLRVRGGFAWSESPFRSGVGISGYTGERFNYTAGVGYRGKTFFADIAYVRTEYKDYYSPYSYTTTYTRPDGSVGTQTQEPNATNSFKGNQIVITVGLKFGTNRN